MKTKAETALYFIGAAQRFIELAYRVTPQNWTQRKAMLAAHARYTGIQRLRFLHGWDMDMSELAKKERRECDRRMGIHHE